MLIEYLADRRQKVRKLIQGILAFIVGVIGCMVIVPAGSVAAAQASAEFELTPILPKNQLPQVRSHFSLNVRPQQVQALQVVVTNLTDHKLTVYQSTGNAFTKTNGDISTKHPQAGEAFKADSSLKYPFVNSFRISGPKKLTLMPHEHVTVTGSFIGNVDLRFAGLIMGGWNFTTQHDHERVATNQSMWVDLHVTKHIQPNIILQGVTVANNDHHEKLVARIQNPLPGLFHGFINATVINDKKQIVSQVEYPQMQIAPNSNFDLDVLASGVHLQSGKYTLKIDAENALSKQQWHLARQLTIAKNGHRQAVTADNKPFSWGWIFGGVSGIIALIAIGGWISSHRKQQ